VGFFLFLLASSLIACTEGIHAPRSSDLPCQTDFPPVQFPTDLGAHINSSFEWWWWLGVVHPVGQPSTSFGLLIMMSVVRACGSSDNTNSSTFFALVDSSNGYQYSSLNEEQVQITSAPYLFGTDDFQIAGTGQTDNPQTIMFKSVDFSLNLQLQLEKPDMDIYLVPGSPGSGTSQPRLSVQSTSSLVISGQTYNVEGEFRQEHQWWEFGSTGAKVHWLWSVFQLSDNYEGCVTLVYDHKGVVVLADSFVYLIDPTSTIVVYDVSQLSTTYSDPWISPDTNNTYYQTLQFVLNDVGLDITLHTIVADNEFSFNGVRPWYEGMSLLSGSHLGASVTGQGNIGIEPSF